MGTFVWQQQVETNSVCSQTIIITRPKTDTGCEGGEDDKMLDGKLSKLLPLGEE